MALHRLASITVGVPDVEATIRYYQDFGLELTDGNWMATSDGGRQLRLVHAPRRRLQELVVEADDPDDIARIRRDLTDSGFDPGAEASSVTTTDPATGVRVVVRTGARIEQPAVPATCYNGPGRLERTGTRSPVNLRTGPVRPRKLGHTVLGTPHLGSTMRLFIDGLGFKVSDHVADTAVFLRCSTDHHNLLLQQAPVAFLHHTSWQVDDVDEIGRGATAMLREHPERHVWGLGRHYAGSNFFWYLKDPAGNFSEYYSDMDCIVDDALWTPEVLHGARGLYSWGPPPPPSFLHPEDLAGHMTGAHA
jgi:catechol 2,3-dioxygenase-like lactoylglutathione lyase family enzyme